MSLTVDQLAEIKEKIDVQLEKNRQELAEFLIKNFSLKKKTIEDLRTKGLPNKLYVPPRFFPYFEQLNFYFEIIEGKIIEENQILMVWDHSHPPERLLDGFHMYRINGTNHYLKKWDYFDKPTKD